MFKKMLSNLIIAGLVLAMIVPPSALAAGGSSLADDFAAKSSTQIVMKNMYDEDLLDVCYYPNNSSFYAVGNNGTMLESSNGDDWSTVPDSAISSSGSVHLVDAYCASNQVAVAGYDEAAGKNYLFLKNNNDAFTKQDLSLIDSGSHIVQAVAISGSHIAVTTNSSKYYHSTDNGATWTFDEIDPGANDSTGSTAIGVDSTTGKFKVYNNSNSKPYQYGFESQVGVGAWLKGSFTDSNHRFTTVKNIYRTGTEWLVLMNNGTSSALFSDNTNDSNHAKTGAQYMLEAAYVTTSGTKILVGWLDDKMIIRSSMEPGAEIVNSTLSRLHNYDDANNSINSWVGAGKLYGIDAGQINGQVVYIAVGSNGSILKSVTDGYQFSPVSPQVVDTTAQIKAFAANDDPNSSTPGQQIAITEDNRVYYSNDGGATWIFAHRVSLSGEVASMQFVNLGSIQRLYIATNDATTNNAASYQMILPNLELTVPLSDFTIRGGTTNTNGIVYYGTTPSNGYAKMASQSSNGGFYVSTSTTAGDIRLTLSLGDTTKFAFSNGKAHVVSLPNSNGSSPYTIPNANGSGGVNESYVAWAQGNGRQLLMDASGFVRVFNNPSQNGLLYNDTLIYTTQGISAAAFEVSRLVFVNGLFALLGKDGSLYTSFDGIIWTHQASLSSAHIVDIAKSNDSLLLLNKNNTIESVALSYNAWDSNTVVPFPNAVVTAPQQPGPYDGTQAGHNEITVDYSNDSNAGVNTVSFKWLKADADGQKHVLPGMTSSTLDLSELSAGTNHIYVEVTYSNAGKVDRPQATRSYGPYSYVIEIPDVNVVYSAQSFTVIEGYDESSVAPVSVTITNTGTLPVSGLQISSSHASVVAGSLSSSTLAAGAVATGQLSIAANQPIGSYSSVITVSATSGNIHKTSNISVNVTDVPRYELDGQIDNHHIQLPYNYVDANDAKVTLTLNNTGNRDIEALTVTLSDLANFELSSIPAQIEAGNSAAITITPKAALQQGSTYNYQLAINSEAGLFTRSVTISVEEAPRYEVTLAPVKNNVTIADDYTNASSGELIVSIQNTGNRDLDDLSVALQGADAGSFTLNTVSSHLAVGQSLSVIATPNANLPINEYNATLSVTSATYGINESEALRLVVSDIPVYDVSLSLSANTLNLAHGYTANDGQITATLLNNGNRDVAPVVSVSHPSVVAVDTVPASLAANTSGSFELNVIENAAAGSYSITLTVSSAAGTQTETINVNIAPAPLYQMNVTADRLSASLRHQYTDASAGKFVLTVWNDGNQDLQNVSIAASDTVNFTVGTLAAQLAVGGSESVEVTPIAGLAPGSYPVTVSLYADQMTNRTITLTVVVASAPVINLPLTPNTSPDNTQPVVTANGEITIPAGGSGTTSYHDNEVVLFIPAHASDEQLTITIAQLLDTTGLNQSGEAFASPVFEILKNTSGNFSNPVTLKLKFDPSLVKENQYAAIFYYDEVNQTWVAIGGEVNGDEIEAQVHHFTKFAVLIVGQSSESASDFSDVEGHWAADHIAKAIKAGFVTGYPDESFKPNDAVTREQFAVMLTQALTLADEGSSVPFSDSDLIGAWAKQAVASAVTAGWITGYSDGSFAPKSFITRAEMAVIIARASGIDLSVSVATSFSDDSSIPQWSKTAAAALQESGIVSGTGSGRFKPQATATRAEAVTIILNLLSHLSQ